jgi:hypothetical protein
MNERNKDIYEMRKAGHKYDEIALKYGVTRERVRQLFLKYERKLNRTKYYSTIGTQITVRELRSACLHMYYYSEKRRKFKNEESDKMLLQKLENLIEVYGETI